MRDHNDVIEFNACGGLLERDGTTPLIVKIKSKKCLAPGISIKKMTPGVANARYEVCLQLKLHKNSYSPLENHGIFRGFKELLKRISN